MLYVITSLAISIFITSLFKGVKVDKSQKVSDVKEKPARRRFVMKKRCFAPPRMQNAAPGESDKF